MFVMLQFISGSNWCDAETDKLYCNATTCKNWMKSENKSYELGRCKSEPTIRFTNKGVYCDSAK